MVRGEWGQQPRGGLPIGASGASASSCTSQPNTQAQDVRVRQGFRKMAHPSHASMPTQLPEFLLPGTLGFYLDCPWCTHRHPRPTDFLPTSWQWGLQGPEPSGAKPHQHSNVAFLPKQGVVREYGDRVLMSRLGRVPSREHGSPPPVGRRPIWLPWHRWKGPRWHGCCPSPPAETQPGHLPWHQAQKMCERSTLHGDEVSCGTGPAHPRHPELQHAHVACLRPDPPGTLCPPGLAGPGPTRTGSQPPRRCR